MARDGVGGVWVERMPPVQHIYLQYRLETDGDCADSVELAVADATGTEHKLY